MRTCLIAILGFLAISADGAETRWRNIYEGDSELAGVRVQQFPDNSSEARRFRGKHPAMILFVFWDGRVRQRGYSPGGDVEEDFWWQLTPNQRYIWEQLDYSKGSDPQFRNHSDPRQTPSQPTPRSERRSDA